MDPVPQASLLAGRGLVGNADQGRRRQVTVIEREVWDRMMTELGSRATASARRANLMISGCRLAGQRRRVLRIGGCRIRILGETRPCERMDEAVPGLRAVMGHGWGGGSFGEVLDDGVVGVGAEVRWDEPVSPNDDGRLE
jgi:MOSC domain-containing protein YiiM